MSVATNKKAIQSVTKNPYPGAPLLKDKWTVSSGNYTPKFDIKGCLLEKGADTKAALNYKLRLDDTADAPSFLTNVIHPCGDVTQALQSGTTAVTVYFFG